MPVPAIDADKRGDAYKKVKPVEGIDEQGLVPDPLLLLVIPTGAGFADLR